LGAHIFSHYTDIVIFVLGYFILTNAVLFWQNEVTPLTAPGKCDAALAAE